MALSELSPFWCRAGLKQLPDACFPRCRDYGRCGGRACLLRSCLQPASDLIVTFITRQRAKIVTDKSANERLKKWRGREKETGMQRLDVSLHSTTYDMLIELVKRSGYDVDKKEKGKGVNGVLTQLIYEIYHRTDKVQLDRKRQQGFLLAQKLKMLKADGVIPRAAKKYIEKEKPSDYLDTEDSEWSIQTLNQLIEEYADEFGPKPPSEQRSKVAKKAPARKKAPVAKKTSKKKASARQDWPADENRYRAEQSSAYLAG